MIYIVCGEAYDYEGTSKWNVRAFIDSSKANEFAKAAQKRANEIHGDMSQANEYDEYEKLRNRC